MAPVKRPRPEPGRPQGAAPGKEPEGSTAKLVLCLAIAAAAIFGPGIFVKRLERQDTRDLMRSLCGSDQPCRDAVVRHFDSCWGPNSSMSLFRKRVQVDREGLVECVNEAAGVRYFEYNEEKDYITTPEP